MDKYAFLIQVLNAVQYGLLLFLVASGLTLIFGIMGIMNLAHGSFYMIGAYMAFSLSAMTGNFLVTVILGVLLAGLIGTLLEWLLFSRFYHRDHLDQVLLSYGLILVFGELRSIAFGNDVHSVPVPGFLSATIALTDALSYPVYRLAISAICIAVAVGLYLVIGKTKLGMMIRAGASNREMMQALGINIQILYRIVFALGVVLAALAGIVAAPISTVYPGMDNHVLIICFVVVVIGGVGSVWGGLVAALAIGLVDTFGKVFLPDIAGALVYVLLAAVLLCKPQGLFKSA